MFTGFRGNPRTRRAAIGVAVGAGVAVVAAITGVGAASAGTAVTSAPGQAHHHFSAAASRIGAATSPDQRVQLTKQALGEASGKNLQTAYDVQPLFDQKIDGTGKTIATLVSYGDKNIKQYIDDYDKQMGLPPADVDTIEPVGKVPACTDPGVNTQECQGWGGETDLDVAMMHTLAPGAKIRIIATPVGETNGITGFPEMMKAMDDVAAKKQADVISMSLGTPEDDFDNSQQLHDLDDHFKKASEAGITLLASSGDDGSTGKTKDDKPWGKQVVSFPAVEPYVTAVGGTVIEQDQNGQRTKPDVLWPQSGGGVSHEFPIPDWQQDVAKTTGAKGRSIPDITLQGVEGTSQSSPLMAAIVALADQSAGKNLGSINTALYAIGGKGPDAGIVDVTEGNNANSGVPGFDAGKGFDIVSGWGTVDAAKFVPALTKAAKHHR